jgi:hypothetical protein
LPTAARATMGFTTLTSFDALAARWLDADQRAQLHAWVYRVGAFVVLNVLDDPAWLALMFC